MPTNFNMSDVMISYSRKDVEFVKRLEQSLMDSGRQVWVDWQEIAPTVDWWAEIRAGIEAAHTFIFVITPNSVRSKVCSQEIDHAVANNKRLIPILREEPTDQIDKERMHPALQSHNWIYFRDQDNFQDAFRTLVKSLETDIEHAQMHTKLLVRAHEWDNKGRSASWLLRGEDLHEAETWLASGIAKEPPPTALQADYIIRSRRATTQTRRALGFAVATAFLLLTMLLLLTLNRSQVAQAALDESNSRGTLVAQQAQISDNIAATAKQAQGNAENNLNALGTAQFRAGVSANDAKNNQNTATLALGQAQTAQTAAAGAQQNALNGLASATSALGTAANAQTSAAGAQVTAGNAQTAAVQAQTKAANAQSSASLAQTKAANANASAEAAKIKAQNAQASADAAQQAVQFSQGQAQAAQQAAQNAQQTANAIQAVAVNAQAAAANAEATAKAAVAAAASAQVAATGAQATLMFANQTATGVAKSLNDAQNNLADAQASATALQNTLDYSQQNRQVLDLLANAQAALPNDRPLAMRLALFAAEKTINSPLNSNQVLVGQVNSQLNAIAYSLGTRLEPVTVPATSTSSTFNVQSVAFGPDNTFLSGDSDGTIQRWDAKTGAPVNASMHYSTAAITSLAFDPKDSSTFVSGDVSGQVVLWKNGIATLLTPSQSSTGSVSVAFMQDGTGFATVETNSTWLHIWKFKPDGTVADGALHVINCNVVGTGVPDPVQGRFTSVAISPDGSMFAAGNGNHSVQLFTTTGNSCIQFGFDANKNSDIGHIGPVESVAFDPDGQSIASGEDDGLILQWSLDGKILKRFVGHTGLVRTIAFSGSGSQLISGSVDNTMRLWNVYRGTQMGASFTGHSNEVRSVAFSPNGKFAVSAGLYDRTVRLWDLDTGQAKSVMGKEFATFTSAGVAVINTVNGVAFSPNGTKAAYASQDGHVRVWDLTNGTLQDFPDYATPATSVAFSHNGTMILSGSDGTALIHNLSDNTTHSFSASEIRSVAFSIDDTHILVGTAGGVTQWDINDPTHPQKLSDGNGPGGTRTVSDVTGVAYSPDGLYILASSRDGSAFRWNNVPTPGVADYYYPDTTGVLSVAADGFGSVLMGTAGGQVVRWNSVTGITRFLGHTGHSVRTVVVNKGGQKILSGSDDTTLRLSDAATGSQIGLTFVGNLAGVNSVALSPDEAWALSGGNDATVRLWPLFSLPQLRDWTCAQRYSRNLTPAEKQLYGIDNDSVCSGITPVFQSSLTGGASTMAVRSSSMLLAAVVPTLTPTATPTLVPEVIKADASQVQAIGVWQPVQDPNATNGYYLIGTSSNSAKNEISLVSLKEEPELIVPFIGSAIAVRYLTDPTMGSFNVTIDADPPQVVVATGNQTAFQQFTVKGLSNAPHTLHVMPVQGTAGIDSFIVNPVITEVTATATASPTATPEGTPTIDPSSAVIKVIKPDAAQVKATGKWRRTAESTASEGYYLLTVGHGASLSMNFEGSTVTVRYIQGGGLDEFVVVVDGMHPQTINESAATIAVDQVVIGPLNEGSHTLQVIAPKGPIGIEGFVIGSPEPTAAFTPTLTPSPSPTESLTPSPTLTASATEDSLRPTVSGVQLDANASDWQASGGWHLDTAAAFGSSSNGWAVGQGEANTTLVWSSSLDLSTLQQPVLYFKSRIQTGGSLAMVEVSPDGSTWSLLYTAASSTDWVTQLVDLSLYRDQPIFIRFRWVYMPSAQGSATDMWMINDILIGELPPTSTPAPTLTSTPTLTPSPTVEQIEPSATLPAPDDTPTEGQSPDLPAITPSPTLTLSPIAIQPSDDQPSPTATEIASTTPSPTATPTLTARGLPIHASMDDGAPDWLPINGWQLGAAGHFGVAGEGWFVAAAQGTATLIWQQPLDLREVQFPQLVFKSLANKKASAAIVQISTDGINWQPILTVEPSDTWTDIAVDLTAYKGQVIQLAFSWVNVPRTDDKLAQDVWLVDDVIVQDVPPTLTPTATESPSLTPTIAPTATMTEVPPTETPLPTVTPSPTLTNTDVPTTQG